MKNLILIFAIFYSTIVGAVAPYGIKGQSQSGTLYSNVHQAPYNQITNLGGINALIETDSENLLVNPNLEHLTVSTGWTLGTSNTFTATTTSANLFSGKQAGLLTTSATVAFDLHQYVTPVSGLAGSQGEVTWALSVPSGITDGQICSVVNSAEQNCVPAINNGVYREYSIPFVFGTAGQNAGIKFKTTATYASGAQTVLVDKARVRAGLGLTTLSGDTEFSAQSSGAGTVSGENKEFITGNAAVSDTSLFTITISGFTVAPNCEANFLGTEVTAIATASVVSTSSTTVVVRTGYNSTATSFTKFAYPFTLICQKSGVDYANASSSAYLSSNGNYSRRAYTPTFTGLGTVTNIECYESREDDVNVIDCKATTGTPTAVEARVSLPGTNVSQAFTSIRPFGVYFNSGTNTTHGGATLVEPSVGYVTFGDVGTFGGGSIAGQLTKQNGNAMLGVGITFHFSARVPISGWTNSNIIVGSFAGTPNVPGYTGRVDTFSVSYGTTNATTVCSATPCSYLDQIGTAVTSITRTGSGDYVVNLARTYTKLKYQVSALRSATGLTFLASQNGGSCSSCNSFTLKTYDTAASIADTFGTISLQGTY